MASSQALNGPRYCIEQSRCTLCKFELFGGDSVVAGNADDCVSCTFPSVRHGYPAYYSGGPYSCVQLYCKAPKSTVCYHDECHSVLFSPPTPKLLAMNSYSFAPSPLEEQRRKTYISHALAQKLPSSGSWPRFLPPELWVMVARFLVRECAAVAAQAQAQGCGDTLTGFLNLSRPVYASYVKTNGCYYVKTLRNHARTDASETTYLLLPRTYTNRYASSRRNSGKDMLVAEDHLGIRRVIFLDSNQRKSWCRNPPSVPGAWWRRISWSWYTTAPRLITVNDGYKVRSLEGPGCIGSQASILWQTPLNVAPTVVNVYNLQVATYGLDALRMRAVDFNAPGIVGYFIVANEIKVQSIIPHIHGHETDIIPHRNDGIYSESTWTYMPMDEGEYITGIYRRVIQSQNHLHNVGFIFTTNQGRTTPVGDCETPHIRNELLASLPCKPYRMYFNEPRPHMVMSGADFIACEEMGFNSKTRGSDEFLSLPIPLSPPFIGAYGMCTYSSCSLQRIKEIHPCLKQFNEHQRIIGLLLHYSDGHRECVGQFHPHWAGDPILVGGRDKLYFCFANVNSGREYVATLATSPPVDQGELKCFEVAQVGLLGWWFSYWHCELYHGGVRLR